MDPALRTFVHSILLEKTTWDENRQGRAMTDFTGKVVVITGAARGLGEATAKVLAACGAKLALCDIDGEGL